MPKKSKRSEDESSFAAEKLLGKELGDKPEKFVKSIEDHIAFLAGEIERCLRARNQFGESTANEKYLSECKRDLNLARQRLAEYKLKLGKN